MRKRASIRLLALLFVGIYSCHNPAPLRCQEVEEFPVEIQDEVLDIGYTLFPPFVMKNDEGELTGFDVDYSRMLLSAAGYSVKYNQYNSLVDKMDAVKSGLSRVGIGGISWTLDREIEFDYAAPSYFNSGIGIMVNEDSAFSLSAFISQNSQVIGLVIYAFLMLVCFIVFGGFLLWIAEQRQTTINDKFFPGVFDGMWCAFTTGTTIGYGDIAPKSWFGRITCILLFLAGGLVFSAILGTFAGISVDMKNSAIQDASDLKGKMVAVKSGSTAVNFVQQYGGKLVYVDTLDQAYLKLSLKDVDAVVSDEPVLRYFSKGSDWAYVVDKKFTNEAYGFLIREGDHDLQEKLDRAHRNLVESGEFEKLYKSYFNGS